MLRHKYTIEILISRNFLKNRQKLHFFYNFATHWKEFFIFKSNKRGKIKKWRKNFKN